MALFIAFMMPAFAERVLETNYFPGLAFNDESRTEFTWIWDVYTAKNTRLADCNACAANNNGCIVREESVTATVTREQKESFGIANSPTGREVVRTKFIAVGCAEQAGDNNNTATGMAVTGQNFGSNTANSVVASAQNNLVANTHSANYDETRLMIRR